MKIATKSMWPNYLCLRLRDSFGSIFSKWNSVYTQTVFSNSLHCHYYKILLFLLLCSLHAREQREKKTNDCIQKTQQNSIDAHHMHKNKKKCEGRRNKWWYFVFIFNLKPFIVVFFSLSLWSFVFSSALKITNKIHRNR